LQKAGTGFDNSKISEKIKKLETQSSQPGFWDNSEAASLIMQEMKHLQEILETWEKLSNDAKDLKELSTIVPGDEQAQVDEFGASVTDLDKRYHKASTYLFLNKPYDKGSAVVNILAGMGGNDAEDFVNMLLRMYLKYCELKGYKTNIHHIHSTDEGGIKSVTFEAEGLYAYGHLKNEKGVHRLIRLSPFKSSSSRQTSFAMLEVLPLLDHEKDLDVDEKDLKIDVFRAGGHGGQSVNTTDSAVRITHLPTKTTATCQNERSQLQNKQTAMKVLKAKLITLMEAEQKQEIKDLKGDLGRAEWGYHIRSYILHPYKMVKDHRTEHEEKNVERSLSG